MHFWIIWDRSLRLTRCDIIIYRLFRVNPYVLIAGGCVVVLSRARVESDYRVEDVLALRLELDGVDGIWLIVLICWCVGRFRGSIVVRRLLFFLTFTELVGLRDGRVKWLLSRLAKF